MSYLKFDKTRLVNLEYSLPKEVLLANSLGVYYNSTIVGCNTRKYHGNLVVPVGEIDGGRHVLLSNLHETVIQHEQEFNLGIAKYPGEYSPKGHKYARWFESDPVVKIVYRVGGVVLQKEIILEEKEARLLIRYTLLEANSPTRIKLKPFLAFRSIHKLSHSNLYANIRLETVSNGFKSRLYDGYPELCLQTSKKGQFVPAPDWYYNVEYSKEKVRGYDYHEDLFTPGYFELSIKRNESIVITAGLTEIASNQIKNRFTKAYDAIPASTGFEQILRESSRQFIQLRNGKYEIISGFPWFGRWGRFSLIPLPGLLLANGELKKAEEILSGLKDSFRDGWFPDHSPDATKARFAAVDTSLWFVWAVQKYAEAINDPAKTKKLFGDILAEIITAFLEGKIDGVHVENSGLLHAYLPDKALTWMDSYVDNRPVTQRPGFVVEINGLWYNALCFADELAVFSPDSSLGQKIKDLTCTFPESFSDTFWDDEKGLMADYVFNNKPNWDVRPNVIIAAAMPYSPMNDEQVKGVLDIVGKELLTPKGLRTLSPRFEQFKHSYEGDHYKRDQAYHQGTVWPWLLGFYVEAWVRLYENSGRDGLLRMVKGFEEDMIEHGICTISEVYDGSPPHRACGAISFAPSVAEILRIINLLSN